MNYCANCISYDYCSARGMCINQSFGYCTQYQPKSVDAPTQKSVGKALETLEANDDIR